MTHQQITVQLGERSYPVYLGRGVLRSLTTLLEAHQVSKQVVVVTDRHVGSLYLKDLRHHLTAGGFAVTAVVVPAGERQKSLSTAGKIYERLLRDRIGRSASVLAFGGGVIGDLAGFIAATYQRGLPLVHVPTSLLAQVDSSIGGKTGVNHPLGKNMIGAFHQPRLVVSDLELLKTLPAREVVCGLGEIVKYGIILDSELFSWLESGLQKVLDLEPDTMLRVASRCVELKSRLVSKDEREAGERIVLNCGHTIGHALEAAGGYRLLKHGEAVLLGLVAESYIARQLNLLSPSDYERIARLVAGIPLARQLRRINGRTVRSMIGRDKKRTATKTRFVLPAGIGQTKVVDDVSDTLVEESLTLLSSISHQ